MFTLTTLRTSARLCLAMLVATCALATPASAETATSGVALNVRNGPGMEHRIVDTLFAGERVLVHTCQNAWCLIAHNGPDGWVSEIFLFDPTFKKTWRATSNATPATVPSAHTTPLSVGVDLDWTGQHRHPHQQPCPRHRTHC